ncbi:MAG: hypothetical protein WD009_03005 [Phycisphaeraceae bacterium]
MASERPTRCVVLVGGEEPVPTLLVDALRRRGTALEVVRDVVGVMLDLAMRGPAAAVIVVEPGRVAHLQELGEAVRRYYRQTGLWTYRGGQTGLERLEAAQPKPGTGTAAGDIWACGAVAAGAPAADRAGDEEPVISPAEMEMLLGAGPRGRDQSATG